jgi:hypothetical protein
MGKRRMTPGTGQLNLEIESTLLERLREFVRERDEKIRHVVEMAIRRHLEYPPPPPQPLEVAPLPPLTPTVLPRAPATPAKRSKTTRRK